MIDLSGLSAFPITPSAPDGRVDAGALEALLDPLVAARVDSIGLLGSTGTYAYLTREQRRRAVEIAVQRVGGRMPLLVGIGALRTDDAVKLAQDARAAGAAAGLLAPVSYTPLTDDEVFEHFRTVARESGFPICIYDNPGTTHFRFSPDLVGRLSRVDGIIAVKSPGAEAPAVSAHLKQLRAAAKDGFSFGYSGDWFCAEALLAGAATWYSVVGGIFPNRSLAIVRAAQRGDAVETRRLNGDLEPLWYMFKTYSSLRVVYAIADIKGICAAEPPRPILSLPEEVKKRIAQTIAGMGLS
jgi:4-hydroxy-tetrahydrodipicolinate synthase